MRGGFITELAPESEQSFMAKIAGNRHKRQLRARPEYMIIPTYGCNFDCTYCFEKGMRKGRGDDFTGTVITREMCDRLCHTFGETEKKFPAGKISKDNPVHITFYGGEPLQRSTKDAVTYLLEKLGEKNIYTFTAITNGYDLECFREVLSEKRLSSLQISLDGIPEIHNSRRILKNSREGTFDKISRNITMALDTGVEINARINTDRDTIARIEDIAEEIEKRGWNRFDNFKATLAPIFRLKDEPCHEKCMNYGQLFNELRKHSAGIPGKGISKISVSQEDSINLMKKHLKKGIPLTPFFKSAICNSMCTLMIFDLYGDMYPCFEKVGKQECSTGNIRDDDTLRIYDQNYNKWRERISTSNPSCGRCSYTLFCGGGCASRAEDRNGTIYSPYCDGFPLFFRSKIRELYLE